jgi:hypothetical protein
MEEKKENSLVLFKLNKGVLFFCFFIFAFFVNLFITSVASAASLHLSPSSGSYTEGGILSVSVFVSSDSAINAISGVLIFPQDKLEVISLSKDGSIMNLWVREPAFSNTGGTISLEGVVLNPGFVGNSGKILTVNFKTKSAGSAHISFNSGSVLANDGYGTNVLSSLGEANFTIKEKVIIKRDVESPKTPVIVPSEQVDRVGDKIRYFSVEESDSVKIPRINPIEEVLYINQDLVVSGQAEPNSIVNIWLEKDGKFFGEYISNVDGNGNFVFSGFPELSEGFYKVWLQTELHTAIKSKKTDPALFVVVGKKGFLSYLSFDTVITLFIVFFSGMLVLLLVILSKKDRHTKRHKNKFKFILFILGYLFNSLKKDMIKDLRYFERIGLRRTLTREEIRLLKNIKRSIKTIDKIYSEEDNSKLT